MAKILYYVPDIGFTPEEKIRRLELMKSHTPDGYEVVFSSPPEGPEFVDFEDDVIRAKEAVREHFPTIGPEDCDVVLLGEALDAVLEVIQPLARVPFVAPGRETLRIAAKVGKPISLIVMNQLDKGLAEAFIANSTIKPPIGSIRSMDIPLRDIMSDLEQVRQVVVKTAQTAVREEQAEAIFLGAMTLNTLNLGNRLRHELGVPVFDPLRIGLRVASEVVYSKKGEIADKIQKT